MIDQENFQQRLRRTNCKPFQKIGQYLPKSHSHSPIFITKFSHSDQHFVPILSCHFLPVTKSNINNFHNFHFLTLEMSSRRHKKTSYINHFLR